MAEKVKLDGGLYGRAVEAAKTVGYASVDEFVARAVEKELVKIEEAQQDDAVIERLQGLGYLE